MKRFFLSIVVLLVSVPAFTQVLMLNKNSVVPGDTIVAMVYPYPQEEQAFRLLLSDDREISCQGLNYPVQGYGRGWISFIPIPPDASPGEAKLIWQNQRLDITVQQRDFPYRRIPLSEDPEPQSSGENRLYRQLGQFNQDQIYWDGSSLSSPLNQWKLISSSYGERRTFTRSGRSWSEIHQGIDYAQDRGYPCYAPVKGRIVLSGVLNTPGNLVVQEIFPGVYLMYFHLDSRNVGEGQIVEAGTMIGRVGSTGKSTGPHLHFEVRVHNIFVDPQSFLYDGIPLAEVLPEMVEQAIR